MYDTHADDGRNADDYPREASPSTGAEETVEVMAATAGATHTPRCDLCDRPGEPVVVRDDRAHRRTGARCPDHTKEFLEVSS